MKKETLIVAAIVGIILAWQMGFFDILFTLLNPSQSQELTNFTNQDCLTFVDESGTPTQQKECVYEADLIGLENSNDVKLKYGLKSSGGQDSDCNIEYAKIDVYNYGTSSYENVYSFSKDFGSVDTMTFVSAHDTLNEGECEGQVTGAGRTAWTCLRTQDELNSDYIYEDKMRFRTTLKSTCAYIRFYDGIEVGYSDWNNVIEVDENTTITCPSGFDYNPTSEKCEKYPSVENICVEGTYNPETNKCEIFPENETKNFFETSFQLGSYEIKVWWVGLGVLILLIILWGKK